LGFGHGSVIFPVVKKFSIRKLRADAQALWEERALESNTELSKIQKFAHFWVMVCRSFSRNRCPVRASALAYATLLALIPMLAVVVGVTSTFLKKEGEDRIDQFIVRFVASVTPPGVLSNAPAMSEDEFFEDVESPATNTTASAALDQAATQTNAVVEPQDSTDVAHAKLPALVRDEEAVRARKAIAHKINHFIQNTRSGTLGLTGSVLLIFVAISMLTRIEDTFNDIWGVARGRRWYMRIILYWGVITLAPILVILAIGLASGPHLESTKAVLGRMPFIANAIFQLLPVVVLCVTFTLFYMLMPNTRVSWRAALAGGLVGGILFHVNSVISVLYVSRVVSYSKVYGSLGLVPVFMVGLYFGWLILLFGAQVAYAFQNRATYMEEKQVEHINQRGREFVALRLMTAVGQRFVLGDPPPGVIEMGKHLCIPTRLIQQVMSTLSAARIVVEVSGDEDSAYLPARSLETITCHDILMAMRAGEGNELTTCDGPVRNEVYGEFERIERAEREAAGGVSLLALVNRAQAKQLAAKAMHPTDPIELAES
jgi:membrane protein